MINEQETRYVRLIFQNHPPGKEDFCLAKCQTDPRDLAYIESLAEPSDWETFMALVSLYLQTMKKKVAAFESKFCVNL